MRQTLIKLLQIIKKPKADKMANLAKLCTELGQVSAMLVAACDQDNQQSHESARELRMLMVKKTQ